MEEKNFLGRFEKKMDGYCPIIEELIINIDNIIDVDLAPCSQLYTSIQDSSDPPLYTEGATYSDNITACRSYSGFEEVAFLN